LLLSAGLQKLSQLAEIYNLEDYKLRSYNLQDYRLQTTKLHD